MPKVPKHELRRTAISDATSGSVRPLAARGAPGWLGRVPTERPRLVLVVTAVLLVVAALLGAHASSKLQSAGFVSPNAPSQLAVERLQAHFGGEPDLVVLVVARHGNVGSPDVVAAGRTLTARLASTRYVTDVVSYWLTGSPQLRSRNGTEALVVATVEGNDQEVLDRTRALVHRISTPAHPGGAVTVEVGGAAGTDVAATAQINHDLAVAEIIALPLTLFLLIAAFGSVVAALLPVLIGLVAILATLAVLDIIGSLTSVSVYALDLTTALSLGLGIDYSLLMVSRFREELGRGASAVSAVRRSVATAGRTIVFSAAAVAAALAALMAFPMYFLRSFAYAGISVIAVAAAAALLVLPAVMTLLGHRVNALAVRSSARLSRAESPFWRRVAGMVMRRPVAAGVPVVLFAVCLGVPFLHVQWGLPTAHVLPAATPARQVSDAVDSSFPSDPDDNLTIVVEPELTAPAAFSYSKRVSQLPGVAQVTGPAGVWADGVLVQSPGAAAARFDSPGASWLSASIDLNPLSQKAQSLVGRARALAVPGGASAEIGGLTAELVDQDHDLGSRLPLALGLIVCTTFVILFLFTGSVVLPLKALVLNGLSLTAVFGAIVWVFQEGHLSWLLSFTPAPTSTTMPLLLFCIAFGLSMDYEVFLLSRIKELHDTGQGNVEAVAGGLARTGRIVTTAAALLAVTFIAFGLSRVSFIKMFGLGTALAIVMDATLVRGVLVPSFMRLAGDANWWAPAPLRRLHRHLGVSEGGAGNR